MRRRKHQSGFSTSVILLAVLVVAVLAVTGLVVYQHHKSSSAKSSAATGTAQTTTQPQNSTTTQSPQATTSYFTIAEWGVRAPYSGSLKLTYVMSPENRTAFFSSDQLTALSSDCTKNGGSITRWASNEQVSNGPVTASTPTASSYFAGKDPSTFPFAHIGNYYYMFVHAQSGCGDINSTAAVGAQTNNAVKALVPTLQASTN